MKVYMSIPVEMLDAPQAEKLYAEMSALLAEHGFEAVSNPAALQPPRDGPSALHPLRPKPRAKSAKPAKF